ncbi:hypothetical protein [Actinoplanes sp. NPDC049265]|uniref:hypothetical protein n=1 Tax=Actinoplanes sp. NPDC049265 TaxID=3363902 RepID=UPI0037225480
MLREELLERIASLPAGTEVGIRFGGELFGIEDVHLLPADDEIFGMLACTSADVRSMLLDWGYASRQIEMILAGSWAGGIPAPELSDVGRKN